MKGKIKKFLIMFLTLAVVLSFCLTAAACGEEEKPGPDDPNPGGEITVERLYVDKAPTRIEYSPNEMFDPEGMVVKATWSDKVTLPVNIDECTIEPSGPLKITDTEIKISYGGQTAIQKIVIKDETIESISVDTKNAVLRTAVNTPIDLSGTVVTAHYSDGTSRVLSSGYTAEIDGESVDLSAITFSERGFYTLRFGYAGKFAEITLDIYDGFIIEAENIKESAAITPEDKNYVERINGSFNAKRNDNEPASGGAYMGDVRLGNVMRLHIYAEESCDAEIILSGSSTKIDGDIGYQQWVPTLMGDMQFNRTFSVKYGSSEDAESGSLEELKVDDDVVLPGGEDPNGSSLLWVNWHDVSFGVIHLEKGDNIVELTVTSDYYNMYDQSVAPNIDRFEVRYVNDGNTI